MNYSVFGTVVQLNSKIIYSIHVSAGPASLLIIIIIREFGYLCNKYCRCIWLANYDINYLY